MNDELISLWRFELSDSTFSYLITIDTEKWIGEKKREAEPFFKRFIFFFLFSFQSFEIIGVKNTVASVKAVSETIRIETFKANVQDLIHQNQYHCLLPVLSCIIL